VARDRIRDADRGAREPGSRNCAAPIDLRESPLCTRLKRVAALVTLVQLGRRVARRLSPGAGLRTVRWLVGVVAAIRSRRREPRLTVAVDVLPLWEPLTGVGWYLERLITALAGRDDIRLRLYGQALVEAPEMPGPVTPLPEGPAIERVVYSLPDDLVLSRRWLLPLVRRVQPLLLAADGNRVVFAPNYILPPLFRLARAPLVATVHDLAIRVVPWAVRPDTRLAMERRLERTLYEARLLITPAHAVAGDLVHHRLAHPSRVRVIHHGPGQLTPFPGTQSSRSTDRSEPDRSASSAVGSLEAYLLYVGTLEPRKNLPTLLAAVTHLNQWGRKIPLVLVGRYGWLAEDLRSRIEAATAAGWLHHLGYLSPGDLRAVYRGATIVAVPSLYEGFGLPAIEAMSAGVPVVLSDIPVFREIAGGAALYADPRSPEAWAGQLARLLDDPGLRRELVARGRARASGFTWERAAERHAEILREAAGIR